MNPRMPTGQFPDTFETLRPKLVEAAQKVYDDWQQVDGFDEELGAGGICQDVAAAMAGVLSEGGIEHCMTVHSSVGENHVFVVAMIPDAGTFMIDIPPSAYEIGSGYVWQKRDGVVLSADDVGIDRIGDATDPDNFYELYAE